MGLRELARAVAAVQSTISIEDPVSLGVTAYPFLPPARNTINLPCFMNTYKLQKQELMVNAQRTLTWSVFTQLLVGDVTKQPDVDSDIAAAFLDKLLERFSATLQLEGAASLTNFRGDQQRSIGVYTWNGVLYVGLDFAMDAIANDILPAVAA